MPVTKGKKFLDQYVNKNFESVPKRFEEGPDYPSFTNDLTGGAVTRFQNPIGG